jgi:prephenate dehydrogenase
VDDIARQVLTLAPACAPGTVVTDAGSTKVAIVAALEGRMPKGVAFVGGHPLAGSEKRGVRYANAELFRDRLTVLTPTPTTDSDALERCICFWQALDSRVGHMTPDHHDRGVALTSHLPHLLAAALAGVLPDGLHELVATGFRSTTRIAAGDPSIWTAIFQENRVALLDALALFEERIAKYKQALTTNDRAALDALLDQGKKVRDALGS